MKKYEFTGEEQEVIGRTLRRIRAVRDFAGVHSGDIGGWIESEENLSHADNAWVSGDAWVYDNARVSGDALVYGDAKVYGDAQVYGGAWPHSPFFVQGTRWSFNITSPNIVRCGCQKHTWQEWHDRYDEISKKHEADDVLSEYIRYFNLACELYGHEDCKIEWTDSK